MNGLDFFFILAGMASIIGLGYTLRKRNKQKSIKIKKTSNSVVIGGDNKNSTITNTNVSAPKYSSWLVLLLIIIVLFSCGHFLYAKFEPAISDNSVSLCPQEASSIGILIFPIQAYTDDLSVDSDIQKALMNAIDELRFQHDIPIKLDLLRSEKNRPLGNINKILSTAEDKCAKIAIWGYYDESSIPASQEIQFALLDPTFFKGISKEYEKLEVPTTRPVDLKRSYSFKKINNLVYTIGAFSAFQQGDYKKTDKLLSLLDIDETKNDCTSAKYFLDWASIYWYLGKPEISEDYTRKAINIIENDFCEETDKAKAFDQLSIIYSSNYGNHKTSIKYSRKAIALTESNFNNQDSLLGFFYTNLATSLYFNKEYEESLLIQKKAVELFENSISSNNNWMLAIALVNLSNTEMELGNYSSALNYLERGFAIEKRIYNNNHSTIASTFSLFSKLHWRLDEFPKAIDYQEKALDIRKKLLPTNHLLLAHSYHNLATLKCDSYTDISKALQYEKKAIKIINEQSEVDTNSLATMYERLFNIQMLLNQPKNAKRNLDYAYNLRMQISDGNSLDVPFAFIHSKYMEFYFSIGDYKKAMNSYDSTVMIFQPYIDKGLVRAGRMAILLNNKAKLQTYMGNCEEAISTSQRVLNYLEEEGQETPIRELAEAYFTISLSYNCANKIEKATYYILEAKNIYESMESRTTEKDIKYARILNLLARIKIKSGNQDEAKKFNDSSIALIEGKFPNGYYILDEIKHTDRLLNKKIDFNE